MSHRPQGISTKTLVLARAISSFASVGPAQTVSDEPDRASFRASIGPVGINPSLTLTNLGVDSNVFNDPDTAEPRSDFTISLTPRADLWLRAGRTWLRGTVSEDLIWYKEYATERSANGLYSAGWLAPFNRLAIEVSGDLVNARDRPGFEIDERVARHERGFGAALELRAFSKTFPGLSIRRRTTEFDDDEEFLGTSLTDLNRTNTIATFTLSRDLTPLTTVLLSLSHETDRFERIPERDADSTRVRGGFQFDPFALIMGSAHVGYRDFRPASADVPSYSGVIADVSVAYVVRDSTRLALQISRDVAYSFDKDFPYYLQTGVAGSLSQRIYGEFDGEVRAAGYRLSYRQRTGGSVRDADRVDRVTTYGAGVGYRLRPDFRIGFNADQQKRASVLDYRTYSGRRYGLSMTYGT